MRPEGNLHVKGSLYNPGLVYDANFNDYLGYVCDVAPEAISPATCARLEADGYATSAENLNLAFIGVSDVTGFATITRTITNVSQQEADVACRHRRPGRVHRHRDAGRAPSRPR